MTGLLLQSHVLCSDCTATPMREVRCGTRRWVFRRHGSNAVSVSSSSCASFTQLQTRQSSPVEASQLIEWTCQKPQLPNGCGLRPWPLRGPSTVQQVQATRGRDPAHNKFKGPHQQAHLNWFSLASNGTYRRVASTKLWPNACSGTSKRLLLQRGVLCGRLAGTPRRELVRCLCPAAQAAIHQRANCIISMKLHTTTTVRTNCIFEVTKWTYDCEHIRQPTWHHGDPEQLHPQQARLAQSGPTLKQRELAAAAGCYTTEVPNGIGDGSSC